MLVKLDHFLEDGGKNARQKKTHVIFQTNSDSIDQFTQGDIPPKSY